MTKKINIARADWERRLNEVSISKEDLNRLIMDYLVIEGYKDAAENLSQETGLGPNVDLESIESRMLIRTAIQRGDIEEAIERVNELDPEILDLNPALHFRLQQQRLIEFIRSGDVASALSFAQQELAPRGEENPEFLDELERTMALFAFDSVSLSPEAGSGKAPTNIVELMSPAQRLKTAGELNAAILSAQNQGKDPKLPGLLQMMEWGETLMLDRAEFPRLDLKGALGVVEGAEADVKVEDTMVI